MTIPAVVQFEITGRDSAALKRFYALLFGWQMGESTITPEYHVVEANGSGIPGGIGTGWDGASGQLTFYVEVDDLEENLYYAEELGGKVIAPPHEIPQLGIKFALFADPEGHVLGLMKRQARPNVAPSAAWPPV
jgi:predicted enzyme related to lactoylglutathione lyase